MNENLGQISEETILTALESSQLQIYDVDYTRPITIEIGANDRPHQDNSIILGRLFELFNGEYCRYNSTTIITINFVVTSVTEIGFNSSTKWYTCL